MGLANCPRCNNLFNKMSAIAVCPNCIVEEQVREDKIKNYLRSHPSSKIKQIAKGTRIKEKFVREILKKPAFQESGYRVGYPCDICGREIRAGKICAACSKEMKSDLTNIESRLSKKSGFVTSSRLKK